MTPAESLIACTALTKVQIQFHDEPLEPVSLAREWARGHGLTNGFELVAAVLRQKFFATSAGDAAQFGRANYGRVVEVVSE